MADSMVQDREGGASATSRGSKDFGAVIEDKLPEVSRVRVVVEILWWQRMG